MLIFQGVLDECYQQPKRMERMECVVCLLSGANGKAAQKHSSKRAGERPAMTQLKVSSLFEETELDHNG